MNRSGSSKLAGLKKTNPLKEIHFRETERIWGKERKKHRLECLTVKVLDQITKKRHPVKEKIMTVFGVIKAKNIDNCKLKITISEGPRPSVLQEVIVPIITNEECRKMLLGEYTWYIKNPNYIPSAMICGGNKKGGKDACKVR